MVIKLRVVQFWPEIILLNSNQTHATRSFDFEITRMISNQIALHSVQLPLFIIPEMISANHKPDYCRVFSRNRGSVMTVWFCKNKLSISVESLCRFTENLRGENEATHALITNSRQNFSFGALRSRFQARELVRACVHA